MNFLNTAENGCIMSTLDLCKIVAVGNQTYEKMSFC